jgi:hypothetical protein
LSASCRRVRRRASHTRGPGDGTVESPPGAVKPWAWELDCARGTGRRRLAQNLVSGARCPTARCPDGASLRCPRSLPNTELPPRPPCGRSPRHRSAHRLSEVAETRTTRPLAASATAPNEPQHQPAGGPHVRDRSLPLRRQRGPEALRPRPYTRYWCRGGHGASPGDGSAWSRISRSPRLARSLHENQAVRADTEDTKIGGDPLHVRRSVGASRVTTAAREGSATGPAGSSGQTS